MNPSFVVIVPARRDSERLPNKPLADIGGEPMLVRTLRQAAKSGAVEVFAAVDDEEISAAVKKSGFRPCMTGECESGAARTAAAADKLNIPENYIIVNVQGDEPFIEPEIIRGAAELLFARPGCVCATAARPLHSAEEFYELAAVKVVADANGAARYFSRAPIPYPQKDSPPPAAARIHIGVYAYARRFLRALSALPPSPAERAENLEQLRILWHGKSIALLECVSESFGVDTPADLAKARARAAQ
ncbi:MAG: 3-deoxy-manno-octulosonate cytidylyltransferase [Betaproteobacteria bacterium]|nr:3-deoxy-manno-octulosonate cytidylyltransferase [Betaproteobacteria bacterium]